MKHKTIYLSIYLFIVFYFFLPTPVYAYIDPGSGNAIMYVIISFFGAFIFSLKGIFYAIIGKKDETTSEDSAKDYSSIVIFSEGKQYWNTFKVVVEKLIENKVAFSYFTMNVNDPCLEIDNPYINNRYIGDGNIAHVKMSRLKAGVVLSTTPNIGTEGFPIAKSPDIKELVHVFHSYDGVGAYHIGSLDDYDTVLTVGDFEEKVIRKLEEVRNLRAKKIVPAGLPYIDELYKNRKIMEANNDGITVLVAPSWSTKGCLREYGSGFIKRLAEAGFDVIIRPHPQSLKVEKHLLDKIKNETKGFANIVWDTNVDGSSSLAKADIMISDASRVRIDFMLIYNKPVITLEVPSESMQQFEGKYMSNIWVEEQIAKFGFTLNHQTVGNIVSVVKDAISRDMVSELIQFRDNHVYNLGNSGEVIAEYLISSSEQYREEKQ